MLIAIIWWRLRNPVIFAATAIPGQVRTMAVLAAIKLLQWMSSVIVELVRIVITAHMILGFYYKIFTGLAITALVLMPCLLKITREIW